LFVHSFIALHCRSRITLDRHHSITVLYCVVLEFTPISLFLSEIFHLFPPSFPFSSKTQTQTQTQTQKRFSRQPLPCPSSQSQTALPKFQPTSGHPNHPQSIQSINSRKSSSSTGTSHSRGKSNLKSFPCSARHIQVNTYTTSYRILSL